MHHNTTSHSPLCSFLPFFHRLPILSFIPIRTIFQPHPPHPSYEHRFRARKVRTGPSWDDETSGVDGRRRDGGEVCLRGVCSGGVRIVDVGVGSEGEGVVGVEGGVWDGGGVGDGGGEVGGGVEVG